MKIALANDHGGFELMEEIRNYLGQIDCEIVDFGCHSSDRVDYPDHGLPAAKAVADNECDRAILVCTTGVGMSMVGNKVRGVRAALCFNEEMGALCREHNFANVLVLAAKYTGFETAKKIIDNFLTTAEGGDRHARRVSKIEQPGGSS